MSERRIFLDYIRDMSEAVQDVGIFTAGMTQELFLADRKTINAVIRSLEVLGEAAGKIPPEIREKYPEIPWSDMVGMRNRLIHEYFGVDAAIIWQTLVEDLPPLVVAIEAMLDEHDRQGGPPRT